MILDSKHTAFVFPGQGSQAIGMGGELAAQFPLAKQTFEEADDTLGFLLSRLMWEGPEADLSDTVNTQPALYVHSLAAYRVFAHLYPDFAPVAVAGHSLGELSALATAGALSFSDGLKLVSARGQLMKRAGERAPGGMAAVLGLDIPVLEQICSEASTVEEIVQVANDNCPGQVVISGAKAAVGRAIEGAKIAGARRSVPLAVSIAAHSPMMDSIQSEWNDALVACDFNDPAAVVIGNVHAQTLTTVDEIRADLSSQMQSRVRWTESVAKMLEMGTQAFVEMGSGNILLGLIRRVDSTVSGYRLGNPDDFTIIKTN